MEQEKNWWEEKRSAYLYRALAEIEANPIHKNLFLGLSKMAENQAVIWEKELHKNNHPIPEFHPDKRTQIIIWLLRRVGARPLRLALAAMKVRGMSVYGSSASLPVGTVAVPELEPKHRGMRTAGNLRAAVFGMSDGLLSNASLIFGIAGANVNQSFILLSGVAGLLAGAFSMGSGEYVSVHSQRQMLEYQLQLEKEELETYPEEEAEELALIYEARGLPKEEAHRIANILIKNPDKALDTLAREELGINPDELGSPWGAAFSSFFSFAIGAAIPILPFIFSNSSWNLSISVALTAISFFCVGAILSLFTQRSALLGGVRMVLIGGIAGTLTYLIGKAFGVGMQ